MNLSSEFAALATFKKLYDKNKDIIDVIKEFILYEIVQHGYNIFTKEHVTEDLNNEFNLNIPPSVVKDSLDRLIHNGLIEYDPRNGYINKMPDQLISDIEKDISDYEDKKIVHDRFIDKLIDFLKDHCDVVEINKPEAVDILRKFILGEDELNKNEKELLPLVGSFILKICDDDIEIKQNLNEIKSQYIIKEGLLYNNDIIHDKFSSLKIYLDMEILFDAYGFNGEIYKELFLTFYQYIKKLNSKGSNIQLSIFDNTQDEIELYFQKAEEIVLGHDLLQPHKPAMVDIVNGCKSSGDIINKKVKFWEAIENFEIGLEYTNSLDLQIGNYLLNNRVTIDELNQNSLGNSEITNFKDHLLPIQYVKVLKRGLVDKKITRTKFIFLTRTSSILYAAKKERTDRKEILYAVDPDYIVNIFWINSGDGLSGNEGFSTPISYVQRVLSDELRHEIMKDYENLRSTENSSEKDHFKKNIAALRTIEYKPENITSEYCNFEIETIKTEFLESKERISKLQSEKSKHENKIRKQKDEISQVIMNNNNTEIKNMQIQTKLNEVSNEKAKSDKVVENLRKKIYILKERRKKLVHENNYINILAREKSNRILKNIRLLSTLFILLLTGFVIFKINTLYTDHAGIISIIPIVIDILLFVFLINSNYRFDYRDLKKSLTSRIIRSEIQRIYKRKENVPLEIVKVNQNISDLNDMLENQN